jgi:hypothetical protein
VRVRVGTQAKLVADDLAQVQGPWTGETAADDSGQRRTPTLTNKGMRLAGAHATNFASRISDPSGAVS